MGITNRAMRELYSIDELTSRDIWITRVHPLAKLIVTISYIACVASFPKYNLSSLLEMVIYIIIGFQIAELSLRDCLIRIRYILPLIILIGVANPILDKNIYTIGQITINAGIISMISLIAKGIFSIMASYILIATTSIEKICYALRVIHIPNVIVTQLLLTCRYITLLLSEVGRISSAYHLRAPKQRGIHFRAWGSLVGLLLLRSIDRANDVYESMLLRGYSSDFSYMKEYSSLKISDILFTIISVALFIIIRFVALGDLIGGLFI